MNLITNDQSIDPNILKQYQILTKLGSGAYGHVWKVSNRINNKQYALKKVYSAFQNDSDAQRTYREISILKKLNHPNIAKLIKVFKAQNDFDLYLVFQLMESDLFKAVKGNILGSDHKKYIIYQIVNTLKYIHSAGVIHRDIKPSNILISSECKIKICDFGLSRTIQSAGFNEPVITEFIATRWYRAPEVMLGSQSYTSKADIWSLGCLIYEMYAHRALLPGKDNIDQIQKLLEFKGFPNEKQQNALRVKGIDKILGHFTIEKKVEIDYFGKIKDAQLKKLLFRIFEYDPSKRPSAQEILQHEFLHELRNYENESISEIKIQLEQSESIKLTATQYRQLIYQKFVDKLKQTEEQPHPQKEQFQLDENNVVIEKKIREKSSHFIKYPKSLKQEIPQIKIKQNHSFKQKYIPQNISHLPLIQNFERKNQSLSLHAKNHKETQLKPRRQKRQDIQYQQMHYPQSIVALNQNSMVQKKKTNGKFKKRTIKQMIQQEEHDDKYRQRDQIIKQQMPKSTIHQNKQRENKMIKSLNVSPEKPSQILIRNQDQYSVLQQSHLRKGSYDRLYGVTIVSKEKIVHKMSRSIKNSSSLHSSTSSSIKCKLPQLIVNHTDKITSNHQNNSRSLHKNSSQFSNNHKQFRELTNIPNQNIIESSTKKNRSFVKNQRKNFNNNDFLKNQFQEIRINKENSKKLNKKSIAHLYNNQMIESQV